MIEFNKINEIDQKLNFLCGEIVLLLCFSV